MDAKGLYRQQSIETASPAKLISMLFHGAIARIDAARASIDGGEPERANADLQRAQEIVLELRASLDFSQGGEIARNLDSLYSFCIERLVEANASKDADLLPAVTATLAGLCEAWDQMVATQAGGGEVDAPGHASYRGSVGRVAAAG